MGGERVHRGVSPQQIGGHVIKYMVSDSRKCLRPTLPLKCMLYSLSVWTRYVQKIEEGYEEKKYLHFDHRYNFPKQKAEIQQLVSKPSLVSQHSFLPLVKVLLKTPR